MAKGMHSWRRLRQLSIARTPTLIHTHHTQNAGSHLRAKLPLTYQTIQLGRGVQVNWLHQAPGACTRCTCMVRKARQAATGLAIVQYSCVIPLSCAVRLLCFREWNELWPNRRQGICEGPQLCKATKAGRFETQRCRDCRSVHNHQLLLTAHIGLRGTRNRQLYRP